MGAIRKNRIPYGILAVMIMALVALVACGEARIEQVKVSPETGTLKVGETMDFNAVALSNRGDEMKDVAFNWSVEGDAGTINESGEFVAKRPGEATIVAKSGDVTGKVTVTVQPQPLARMDIETEAPGALPGSTLTLRVTGLTSEGKPAAYNSVAINVPTEGAAVSTETITLDENGVGEVKVTLAPEPTENVFVFQSGDVIQRVPLEGTKVARIEISPGESRFEAGQTVDFKATIIGKYGSGREAQVSWTLTGTVAELMDDGKVFMKSPGQGIIIATYEGVTEGWPFTVVPGKVARIEMQPGKAELKAGESVNFDVLAFNAYGYPVRAEAQWSVDGNVGSVAKDGMFLARTTGTGAVKAIIGDAVGQAQVEVSHGTLASVEIEMKNRDLTAGETVDLAAYGLDAFGNRFDVSPQWYLTKPVGTINDKGRSFTALHTGRGEIRAQVGNLMNSVSLKVSPAELAEIRMSPKSADMVAGETLRFEVRGFDRLGNYIDVSPEFAIREQLGDLDPSGVFAARKAGSTTVQAQVGNFTAESTLAVTPAQMARIVAEPSGPVELMAGDMRDFDVFGVDRFGNTVEASVQWRVTPSLGQVDEQGVFFPRKAGKGQIVASVSQPRTGSMLEAKIPIAVTPGQTERIDIQPASLTTVAGREVNFSATTYDRFGNETDDSVQWSLAEPSVGSITENGRLVPMKAKSEKVLAKHGNVVAAAEIEVRPAQVAFLKIVPDALELRGGERFELNAIAEDRFGNNVDADIVWSLSKESLGNIADGDVLIARKVGTGSLVATARNIVDTAPLTVAPGEPVAMTIEPSGTEVAAGTNVPFKAVALDAAGNRIAIDPEWSTAGELGDIGTNGILLTRRVGTVQVTANFGGMQQTAEVKVVPGTPASIELQPERINTEAGEVVQLSYTVYDKFRNVIPNPRVDWHVENQLGRVTSEGDFLAKKAGEGALRLTASEAWAAVPVKVVPGNIAVIEVEPSGVKLAAGQTESFTATAYDSEGNRIEDFKPDWGISGHIGEIDENGALLAKKIGNGFVTAKSSNVTGLASVGVLPGAVARIDIRPGTTSVDAGGEINFEAVAYDAFGNVVPTDFSWMIASARDLDASGKITPDEDFGSITSTGIFEAKNAGDAIVIASAVDISGNAEIVVKPGDLEKIDFSPKRINLTAGDKANIEINGKDAYGNVVAIDPSFSVEPSDLGYVGKDGAFVAQKAGRGMLYVSAQGIQEAIAVSVGEGKLSSLKIRLPDGNMEAGKTYDLNAVGYDMGGNIVPADPKWAVTEDIGWIDQSRGILHAKKAGKGLVVARDSGIVAERLVEVEPGSLAKLFISPNPVTVKAGTVHNFEAYGYDELGNSVSISGSAVDWSVAGDIGRFRNAGEFLGTSMGRGKVVAKVNDVSAESYVEVAPGTPDPRNSRVRVSYPTLSADGQAYTEVIVEVRDKYNNPVPGADVTLVSDRPEDAIIQPAKTNAEGLARGRMSSSTAGVSTVQAVVGGRTFADSEQITFG